MKIVNHFYLSAVLENTNLFIAANVLVFLVKRVPGRGLEQRESDKTVLYLQIIIILISYIIIKLLIKRKMRTIPAETGNGTPCMECFHFKLTSVLL
jgi:hypothetical protein